VQALYDLVIGSMDWGSGFWTVDDAMPVLHIAETCGFAGFEEARQYVESQADSPEQREFLKTHLTQRDLWPPRPHDHVFSKKHGKCMWPGCSVVGKA
jgi:hypothetical protein